MRLKKTWIFQFTTTDLQDELIGPINFKEYREQARKRTKDVKSMLTLSMYVDSVFQGFESFLKPQIDFVEDDNNLVLDEYSSSFVTYKLEPGI